MPNYCSGIAEVINKKPMNRNQIIKIEKELKNLKEIHDRS